MPRNSYAKAKTSETNFTLLATIWILGLSPIALGLSLAIAQMLHFAR
jgi:hypothetical protein